MWRSQPDEEREAAGRSLSLSHYNSLTHRSRIYNNNNNNTADC